MSDRRLYGAVAASALLASALTWGAVRWTAPAGAPSVAGGDAVRDYLLANPEIIPEAMDRLRAKETAQLVAANRKAVETPFAGAWMGAENPEITLVQFFDYACGYCRASLPHIERLLAEDKKLRVVFRELPVLSQESETAARLSLAAAEQGRYAQFHKAMYAAGRPGDETIAAAREQAGLDAMRARADALSPAVEQELQSNFAIARQLGFTGTPAWVVGDRTLSGAVGYEALKAAVEAARARS